MALYTIDIQLTRDAANNITGLIGFDHNSPDGIELISSHQLYADLKSVYFRLEVFAQNETVDSLRERIEKSNPAVLQHRVREDVSIYEGPLLEVQSSRNIEFRKNFVATAPTALRQARERLYTRPEDLERLNAQRIALITDGSRYEHRHHAALYLERDAYLLARHANLQPVPLWLDSRNEEDLIRSVQALAPNFSSIRISGLRPDYAMEVVDRLEELVPVPLLHAEAIERAVLMAAILQNAARSHELTLSESTGAIIGLGPEGEGLLEFLLQLGVNRVYGIDSDLRQLSRFEKKGGIASSIDHIYESPDFIVITPDCPVVMDDTRFRAGQLVLSFHPGSINPRSMAPAVAESCYQGGEPHPVFVLPGLAGAIHRSRPRRVTQELLRKFMQTLVTRGTRAGFLPVPSQDLFKVQFESLE